MRFIRLFIISLFMCALLCSCKTPDIPAQTTPASVLQVQVSINPELVIDLDAQGNICNVTCKNADAEAICKDLPYANVSFDQYLTVLLENCIQQGYLSNGGQVSVQILGNDTPLADSLRQSVTHQAQNVLQTVSQSQNLAFAGSVDVDGQLIFSEVLETQPAHHQVQYDPQGNLVYYRDLLADGVTLDVYLDPNGSITKEIHTNPDGSGSMTQYNAQGLQVLFEDYGPGNILFARLSRIYHNGDPLHYTETNQNNESTEYKCDPDGSINYSRFESAIGELYETWFENGVIIKSHSITTGDDGTKVDTYFEKGIITSETRIQPDGVRMETSFDNGVPVLENWTAPDGEVWEVHYENGVISKSNGIFGDSVWYKIYTNGVMTLYRRDASDGTYWEERYTESGVLYYHATYHAGLGTGSIDTITFNPNGTKASQFTKNVDGSTYEVTFDANGKEIAWYQVDANGNITQGTYNSDGHPIH